MLTISVTAIDAARTAAVREGRSLSNYTSRLYELAARVRLADIERLAAAATEPSAAVVVDMARCRQPKRAEAR